MSRLEKKFYGWTLVGLLAIIYFINVSFPMYAGSVINSHMAKTLNMSRSILGLGYSTFSLTYSISAPLIALSINQMGVNRTIFLGSLLISVGSLIMAYFVKSNVGYLVVYGLVIGLGEGFGAMIPVQTAVTYWFKRKKSLAMSIVMTSAGIGGFVASPIVNRIIISQKGNWRSAWFLVSGLSIVSAIISIFVKNKPDDLGQVQDGIEKEDNLVRPKKSNVYFTESNWTIKEIISTSSFWLITFGSSGLLASFNTCVAHGTINLMDKGIAPDLAAMSIGLMTLFSVFGRLAAGFFGDRYEPKNIFSIGLLLTMVGCFFATYTKDSIGVYVYAGFMGIGFGASSVCLATIYGNYYGEKAFASIMGIIYPIRSLIGCLSPVVAGILYDIYKNYNMAFTGVGVIAGVGAICLFFTTPIGQNRQTQKTTQMCDFGEM